MTSSEFNFEILFIMIIYAVLNGLGSLFFKMGLKKVEIDKKPLITLNKNWINVFLNLLRNPIWTLGWILLIADFFVKQIALQKYEISVVGPLINLNLIFVIAFGVIFMKEKIIIREYLSIIFIIIGAFALSYNSTESINPPIFLNLIIYSLIIFFGVAISILSIIKSRKKKQNYEFFISILSGCLYGVGGIYNKAILNPLNNNINYYIIPIILFGLSYGLAFLFGQYAYSEGRMSLVSTLVNIISILIAFIGGLFVFGEPLFIIIDGMIIFPNSFLKILGLMFIILGVLLSYSKKK